MIRHSAHDANAPNLLQNYAAGAGVFDEVLQASGLPRPHWQQLLCSLEQLGPHALQSRWEDGRRIIREHGVTYNLYGDPEGMDRPWGLDLVPMLITGEEWASLEAGLVQRSRLFNLILADIYAGPQRLLRDGFLPPELVYANPAFLRSCRGIPVTGQVYLQLHGCDLGRSPDGRWWVLADRTQAPTGTGYTWENRTVVSRILPEQIRNCQVQRLAGFFQRQRDMLYNLAPSARNQPSVVLLSPGPQNESYFEHPFLARNLGFPLVEGADLVVRDRRVFLKTIEGLQPVDVILRRVDDWLCDPLELRGDSLLGVSGLIEATRAGNVTIANALGAGLMESPAFLAFLPGLCQHLLGQELLLPSIATWWCGQGDEFRYVAEHLDSLVLKSAFTFQPPPGLPPPPPANSRRKRAEYRRNVLDLIRASPKEFVAQEPVRLSRAPAWVEDHLEPRPFVLRAYVANAIDSSIVLPGGLTRTSRISADLLTSPPSGSSKDTWVLSKSTAGHDTTHVPSDVRLAETTPAGVPSRVADHLFWLGRYTERLEQLLRVVRCLLGRNTGELTIEDSPERRGLAELAANLGFSSAPAASANGELSELMLRLLYDPDHPGGVRELARRIRLTASAVRDRFSGDTWRILGRLDADARSRKARLPLAGATAFSHHLVLDLAAFNGMEMENMTRGRAWRFLDFGRRLERGLSVLKLLRSALNLSTQPAVVLEPVLEIADSVMTYRRQYFAAPQLPGVLALLLCQNSNPRSLAFQVDLLSDHVAALKVDAPAEPPEAEQTRIDSLADSLRSVDLKLLAAQQAQGDVQPLLEFFDSLTGHLSSLSDQITNHYFTHTAHRVS